MKTNKLILDFLLSLLEKRKVDAFLLPIKIPSGDYYNYILTDRKEIIEKAKPIPPVMPAGGARALQSFTRLGNPKKKIGVIMSPCQIKAGIELYKIKQVRLENLYLFTYTCPGVFPSKKYFENPNEMEEKFERGEYGEIREVCKICDKFDNAYVDVYIGIKDNKIYPIPRTEKGKELLKGFKIEKSPEWEDELKKIKEERQRRKEKFMREFEKEIEGIDALLSIFSKCVNCHNCMRACPVCYCRQCFFDSDALKLSSENYLLRAKNKGALRFPTDTLLFHLGRMSHMIFSCVNCGNCEDACPMDIPIGKIFTFVAEKIQKEFGYIAGRDPEEKLPLVIYQEEEFEWVEKPYIRTYRG